MSDQALDVISFEWVLGPPNNTADANMSMNRIASNYRRYARLVSGQKYSPPHRAIVCISFTEYPDKAPIVRGDGDDYASKRNLLP